MTLSTLTLPLNYAVVIDSALRVLQNYEKHRREINDKFRRDLADLSQIVSIAANDENTSMAVMNVMKAVQKIEDILPKDAPTSDQEKKIRTELSNLSRDLAPYRPVLYLLVRTDMASMNAGKGMAQASHAANQMVFEAKKKIEGGDEALKSLLGVWENEANGFGTCYTLGAKYGEVYTMNKEAATRGLHGGICHDPTYPLIDGETVHFIPVNTCSYILCRKGEGAFLTEAGLELHP